MQLVVVVSGENRGTLERCGCQQNQAGGISRRGSIIQGLRAKYGQMVLLDSGNLTPPDKPDRDKTETLLEACATMGYDAVAFGPAEETLGREAVVGAAAKHNLPLIGGAQTTGALPDYYRRIDRGGIRFGLLSLSTPSGRALEQMDAAWKSDQKSVDVWVVFNRLGLPGATIRQRLPAPTIIVCPNAEPIQSGVVSAQPISLHKPSGTPAAAGDDLVVMTPELFGLSLSSVEVRRVNNRVVLSASQNIVIPAETPQDPAVRAVIARYTSSHKIEIQPPPDRKIDAALYQKATGCRSCHAKEYAQWSGTGHAHSWETLVKKQASTNAECITCHTTPVDAGFEFGADTGVGCQSCHGDTTLHSLDPRERTGLIRKPAERQCRRCHDAPNSPNFRYTDFLRKVRH